MTESLFLDELSLLDKLVHFTLYKLRHGVTYVSLSRKSSYRSSRVHRVRDMDISSG